MIKRIEIELSRTIKITVDNNIVCIYHNNNFIVAIDKIDIKRLNALQESLNITDIQNH